MTELAQFNTTSPSRIYLFEKVFFLQKFVNNLTDLYTTEIETYVFVEIFVVSLPM